MPGKRARHDSFFASFALSSVLTFWQAIEIDEGPVSYPFGSIILLYGFNKKNELVMRAFNEIMPNIAAISQSRFSSRATLYASLFLVVCMAIEGGAPSRYEPSQLLRSQPSAIQTPQRPASLSLQSFRTRVRAAYLQQKGSKALTSVRAAALTFSSSVLKSCFNLAYSQAGRNWSAIGRAPPRSEI